MTVPPADTVDTADPADLDDVIDALATWQVDGLPVQLHPGDLGWHRRLGDEALAQSLRAWWRDGHVVAVAFTDGTVARLGLAPAADADEEVARRVVDDLTDPARGVLTAPESCVEARYGQALRAELERRGWPADEPWTPLARDLRDPVETTGLDVAVVGPADAAERVAVQRAAFANSTFTTQAWTTMAQAPTYRNARCLLGRDAAGRPVAAATVWSAGPGRPGLLEPMGVDRERRGQGYGRAITLAAAAALREMGASCALVATPTANTGGVATYAAAGFTAGDPVTDYRRPA